MASVFAVLTVVFVAICVVNYQNDVNSLFNDLETSISLASGGQRNGTNIPAKPEGESIAMDGKVSNLGPQQQQDFTPPEIGGQGSFIATPVAVFTVDASNNYTLQNSATTASISDEVLEAAETELSGADDGQGSLKTANLYYKKKTLGNATYVAFADKSSVTPWSSLAITLVITELVTLAIFLCISILFARWAIKPIEKTWKQQEQFIADASHELKTPLTVILANSSILQSHPEKTIAEEENLLESTKNEAQRMQELVCDMLDLQKTGQKNEVMEEVDFSDLVMSKALQFEAVAFEKQVEIDEDVENNIKIQGNEVRLARMVSVLLDNACKYSAKHETVRVTLKKDDGHVVLKVNNLGNVISPEDLEHVFDRFYRADKARSADSGSYGLGLAIAQQIAFDHGGKITCTSNAQNGTTFTVTL